VKHSFLADHRVSGGDCTRSLGGLSRGWLPSLRKTTCCFLPEFI